MTDDRRVEPTQTYHFAPLVAAAVWPVVGR